MKAAVRPPVGMYTQAQRFFAKFFGDYDLNKEEEKQESKKRFFKFLQTAESLETNKNQKDEIKLEEIEVSFESGTRRPMPIDEEDEQDTRIDIDEIEEAAMQAPVEALQPFRSEALVVREAKRLFSTKWLV